MGVITTADRKLEEAKEHLKQAQKCLNEIVNEDCWGSDEYSEDYFKRMYKSLEKIIKIRRKLS